MNPTWQSVPSYSPPGPPPAYTYPVAPAYTPVQVRSSFSVQSPPPPPASSAYSYPPGVVAATAAPVPAIPPSNQVKPSAPEDSSKRKINWPDSVRRYVQRSFEPSHNDPTVTRQEMEAKLKQTITHATDNGTMYTIDWDAMPLPQQIIKNERTQALLARTVASYPPPPTSLDAPPPEPIRMDSPSKKRKSSDFNDDMLDRGRRDHLPRGFADKLEGRVTFASPDRIQSPAADEALISKSKSQKQLEKRQKHFNGGYKSAYRSPSPPPSTGPVVGTCETLEKRYLRLTAALVPSQVRPECILRQTLKLLKSKWRREANHLYICNQFKSLRQDLTVQRIRNDFTVSVYEIHARIALEKGDLGEYNQCQTQLRALYRMGLKGNAIEFKAYRVLYFIHTANRTALNDAFADLTSAEKEVPPIKHALSVRSALALGNYHRFFQLYLDTPHMGAYLMDKFVGRERLAALCKICKSYKPDVKLRFITEELGFESDADAAQFIIDHQGQHLLDERDNHIAFLTSKAGALFEGARAAAFSRVDIKGQI